MTVIAHAADRAGLLIVDPHDHVMGEGSKLCEALSR